LSDYLNAATCSSTFNRRLRLLSLIKAVDNNRSLSGWSMALRIRLYTRHGHWSKLLVDLGQDCVQLLLH
jgi:hypothetical protein